MNREKKADFIGKIIVIGLIGVFIAVGIFTMVGKNTSSMAGGRGMPGFGQGSSNQTNAVTVSIKAMEPETIQKTVLFLPADIVFHIPLPGWNKECSSPNPIPVCQQAVL